MLSSQSSSDCLDCQGVIQKNSSSFRKTQNLKLEKSAAKAKLLRLNQSKRNPLLEITKIVNL
ncbi:hypothetical protein NIES298_38920 [Microcystis aeruginosa NIES-298]|jgi:hypothetical protein|uniref:Uncharacterized protein n=1 Tax=Microcystis aeruginosa TAIHU98 TaxID=1134457 RepID=L7EC55_MICAE|nr:hypothetical protein O53_1057 [Microcystis aeruginosa TAIHU98]ODV36595.1 hypothetical protein BFG60_3939 [Microcystis aeruginosa NIES-98]GBE99644.1 hypothetical protein NIES298_38920 [Microcystis aeruginosa NIES-298]